MIKIYNKGNIIYLCKYKVVFCSKYRKKVLVSSVSERLKELFQPKTKDRQAEMVEMKIMPDHALHPMRSTIWDSQNG
jgi:putative transposase